MQLFFVNQAPASVGAQGDEIYLGHDPQDCSYYDILLSHPSASPDRAKHSQDRSSIEVQGRAGVIWHGHTSPGLKESRSSPKFR